MQARRGRLGNLKRRQKGGDTKYIGWLENRHAVGNQMGLGWIGVFITKLQGDWNLHGSDRQSRPSRPSQLYFGEALAQHGPLMAINTGSSRKENSPNKKVPVLTLHGQQSLEMTQHDSRCPARTYCTLRVGPWASPNHPGINTGSLLLQNLLPSSQANYRRMTPNVSKVLLCSLNLLHSTSQVAQYIGPAYLASRWHRQSFTPKKEQTRRSIKLRTLSCSGAGALLET